MVEKRSRRSERAVESEKRGDKGKDRRKRKAGQGAEEDGGEKGKQECTRQSKDGGQC